MRLNDLFKRDDVLFVDWLPNDLLKDEWQNSRYFKGENIHKWELSLPGMFEVISFDGKEYSYTSYDEYNQIIFEKIVTEEEQSIS